MQFNRTCRELTGYSLEEVKGRRLRDFLVPADEKRAVGKIFKEIGGGTPNQTENRDLARELHDTFSQELAALGMEISTLPASAEVQVPLTERLADLGEKIRRLADEMHRTSRRLHPAILSELGLEVALREECDASSQQNGIPTHFTCENLPSSMPQKV